MRVSQIKKLFPVTVEVTQEIINSAFIMNAKQCVGALILKSILPDENKDQVYWGVDSGGIWKKGALADETVDANALLLVKSVDENGKAINMMQIKEPQTVILTIK